MQNYLDLIQRILDSGNKKPSRAGDTISTFGECLSWDLSEGFPMLTTRKVPLRFAFEETMFFLRGQTDTTILEQKKINIWKGNTSREFLDGRNLQHLPVGSIGTGYSHQWRNFGGAVGMSDGVDQVKAVIDGLRTDPYGRRHIILAWNPQQLDGTPLPPCHLYQQYVVNGDQLDSSFVMRSNDVPFGLPFNIMGYALLNVIFAQLLNLKPGKLVYFGNDVHIYANQVEMCREQLLRTPRQLPTIVISKELNTLDDVLALEYGDIQIHGYDPYPDLGSKPPMAI